MSARFVACQVCARHVREGDRACPFCGAGAPVVGPRRTIPGRLSRAAMHAAGAAGAFLTLNDCSSGGGAVEGFYGAPCVDGSCNYAYDSGQTGYEGGGEPFYGGSCVGEECGVAPVPDAGADADAGGEDGPSGDAPGDGTVGDGPTDAGDGG
jgi:hypothetical protein